MFPKETQFLLWILFQVRVNLIIRMVFQFVICMVIRNHKTGTECILLDTQNSHKANYNFQN